MNAARIRSFLLQHPKPSIVRVSGDGEPQELRPGRSYARCAETIAALGIDLIECLDSEQKLLRALRVSTSDAQRSDAAALPTGLEADPSALMLTHFANLIHRAYEHSTEVAFSKMVDLVERINDRSEAIETRLERAEAQHRRTVEDQIDDAFERARELGEKAETGDGDLLSQMASAFMGGAQPAAKPNGKTANGKG